MSEEALNPILCIISTVALAAQERVQRLPVGLAQDRQGSPGLGMARLAGGEHEVIAFGLLIIIIMIFLPEGLTAGSVSLIRRLRRRSAVGNQ